MQTCKPRLFLRLFLGKAVGWCGGVARRRPHIRAAAFILSKVRIFKRRYYSVRQLRRAGVKVVGREVFVERGARVAAGAALYSPCYISGPADVQTGATLLPGCVIDGAKIGAGSVLGPFCNVRANCAIGKGCRVGNFVELKCAVLGDGCKAAHLSYIGDAELGKNVNIGCGVVFANYDGKVKSRTYVGDNAFIGCNSNIIAPAHIGAGAYVAAGTNLSGEVAEKSFAISRAALHIKSRGAEGRYLND